MAAKIGIILFPGTNCELETIRACKRSNLNPELFRWNQDSKTLKKFDAFIIPGGFSYEDRGRSGVIASKDPIMETIKNEANKGKAVLGICNGAQIVVESGMIPGLNPDNLEMALAWNERIKKGQLLGVGFYNDWIYIRTDAKPGRTPFNRFSQKIVMKILVANGEGRYTTKSENVLESIIKNDQAVFRFCDANGKINPDFPTNPNGAIYNIAGICNPEGNVLSLMPHPERTINGQPIFDSLAEFLNNHKKVQISKVPKFKKPDLIKEKIETIKNPPDITITVKLIITDNEERTIENALKNLKYTNLKLKRQIYYGIYLKNKENPQKTAEEIISSGEIINLNKEIPTIQIGDKFYSYSRKEGLVEKTNKGNYDYQFYTAEYDNYLGKNIEVKLNKFFQKSLINKVERGTLWQVNLKKAGQVEKLVQSHIFHNPHSMKIVTI